MSLQPTIKQKSPDCYFFKSGNSGKVIEFLQTGNILEGDDAGHFFNTAISLLHLFLRVNDQVIFIPDSSENDATIF
jgi:hypothetical protein